MTAAPTRPTRRASSGISDFTLAGATMRMPPLVDRRITQYVQPREQPRSASIRNMSRSSVCGVRIGEHAGRLSSLAAAIAGSRAPWSDGT